jgi:hypothetical protein
VTDHRRSIANPNRIGLMTTRAFIAPLAAAVVLIAGCTKGGPGAGKPVVERTVSGDTTIVRTVSGSAWGDTAKLVEEVRIGALEGAEELTFGGVGQVAPGRGGSVDVFDNQAIALRRYDSAGHFVKTIGGRGQGPGEYQQLLGVRTLGDGRLVAYDGRTSRITTYSPAGEPLETWPLQLPTRMFSDNSFAVDRTDHVYVLTSRPTLERGPPQSGILLRVAPDGHIVDTLDVPSRPANAANRGICLAPGMRWALHASGQFLTVVTDNYSLDLRQPEGKVLRIQRVVEPVAFESGERSELEADIASSGPPIESMMISAGKAPVIEYGPRQTVPPVKPLIRNILAAADGRIWVQRHTHAEKIDPATETVRPACNVDRKGDPPTITWREPIVWDVFEETGTYLGAVAVPPRTTIRAANGDMVWAVQRGESDEEYVVRYRIARNDRP